MTEKPPRGGWTVGRGGKRTPPVATQFKPGHSGNPNGRPCGSGARSSIEKTLARKVTVTVDGKKRRVPATEAVAMQLLDSAFHGDKYAIREVMKLAAQTDQEASRKQLLEEAEEQPKQVLIHRTIRLGCASGLMLYLGLGVDDDDGGVKLFPWVIEEALKRLPTNLLNEDHLVLLAQSCSDLDFVEEIANRYQLEFKDYYRDERWLNPGAEAKRREKNETPANPNPHKKTGSSTS